MEALAVVSLVGNIIQFLDFATELVSKSAQIHQSTTGAAASTADTETAAQHLLLLIANVKPTSGVAQDDGFADLCVSCQHVAEELLSALTKVKAKNTSSKWESVRKALRTIWSSDEIAELERRLNGLRAELNLHVAVDVRDQIHRFKVEHSAEIKNLDLRSKTIVDAIDNQHRDISSVLQSQGLLMLQIRDGLKEIELAKTQSASANIPSSNVPFRRDLDFVDRPELLKRTREKCAVRAGRAALVGLGGAGKSQLAIEYSYQLRESQPQTWVFWVYAGTAARFEEGYRAIAQKVKLPDRDKPKVDILKLVYEWLCSAESGNWLLILDNADDASIFFKEAQGSTGSAPKLGRKGSFSGPALSTFLPQSQNGAVLITTRVEDVAFKLTGSYDAAIRVNAMDNEQAVALLRTKLGFIPTDEDAGQLVKALDCIPLAISQAAAYIRQRAPRSSVTKYLHDFRKSEYKKTSLLSHDAGDLRRDPSASNSITVTWYMSFDHIRATRPTAAELLSLMSFFDQQDIPEYLVRSPGNVALKDDPQLQEDNDSAFSEPDTDDGVDDGFEDDVATLRNYSLISVNQSGTAFKMHSLVQLSTRTWLEDHGQSENWKGVFVSNLSIAFPTAEFSNWNRCQELFSHAEAARRQPPAEPAALEKWAFVMHNAGAYAMAQGKFSVAGRMTEKAAATREKILGPEHPLTLSTNCNLGLVRRCQGRYHEAETVSRQVLAGREKVLGRDHLDTLTSVNNLGAVLRYQGKYQESEELNRRVCDERERLLGPEHQDTLTSLNNLALILRYQGKYASSEVYIRKALQGTEIRLGQDHPETIRNLSKLATILQKQGKYEQSEAMQRQAIERYTRVLGKEHPDTITGISKLAVVLGDLGRYEEAQAGMRQVLAVRERILGKKHPSTLASAANLASLLQSSGSYPDAELVAQQALEGREDLLGEDHPDTLTSVHFLALILQEQGKDEEAEALHLRAFRGREEALGPEHPDTITTVYSLACLQHKQKRYQDASRLYQRATISYEANLGQVHPTTIACKERYEVLKAESGAGVTVDRPLLLQ
jgi:tetratricopeptide (TPR) repeat protein